LKEEALLLSRIQKEIEETYRIACPVRVDPFVMDEESRGHYSKTIPWLKSSHEAILIRETEEDLDVGLLFDPRLLEWSRRQGWENLTLDHLETAGPLIEGVSHFVSLLWHAERKQAVSALELEIQAEVDKFVLFSRGTGGNEIPLLFEKLFTEISWRPDLNSEERGRYETAARLASQYCHFLKTQYLSSHRQKEIYPELRSFYRKPLAEKIRYIQA
jgi:hypothetical protein